MHMRGEVLRAIEKYQMLSGVRTLAVALSGGADSCALLHIMLALRGQYGINVCAVHVNHGIRGAQAQRDEDFCIDLCGSLGVRLAVRHADVPALALEWGVGLEEAGRRSRYAAIEDARRELGFERVATAHHADDNLETLLFNLSRGCGLRGLCGIPPVRDDIIRPLIFCTREDILGFCSENSVSFVTDSTNADERYTRNFIRAKVVLPLKTINASIAQTASAMCETLRADEALLSGAPVPPDAPRSLLAALPDAVLSRYIISAFPGDEMPGSTHICAVIRALRSSGTRVVSLPGGKRAVADADRFYFEDDERGERAEEKRAFDIALGRGTALIEGLEVAAGVRVGAAGEEIDADFLNIYNLSIYQAINFGKIKGNIRVRSRRAGDTYLLGGMRRTLKKLMQSHGISELERGRLPFFCDDEGIAWIPGFPPRDGLSDGAGELGFALYTLRRKQ